MIRKGEIVRAMVTWKQTHFSTVMSHHVPLVVLPIGTSGESACGPQKDWIPEELNLQGLEEWPKEEQDQARKLMVKWEHLFACSNLDLGKTSLIRHQIKLTDQTPFKGCYC